MMSWHHMETDVCRQHYSMNNRLIDIILFSQRPNAVLSEQRNSLKGAGLPFPLYAALSVKANVCENVYHGKYGVLLKNYLVKMSMVSVQLSIRCLVSEGHLIQLCN